MILDEIAAKTKKRLELSKKRRSTEEIKKMAESMNSETEFPFEKALAKEGISYICEVKKASPSKGIIADDFDYLSIAMEYEQAGANIISVLTEPDYFMGDIRYLMEIHKKVSLPILRKDFIIDEYMIYEAKVSGAAAVLLICALLSEEELRRYIKLCDSLGLSALVEAHDEKEIRQAVCAGARVIGVNNRNLKDFTVDIHNGIRLRCQVPKQIFFVAESGIKTREDIVELEKGNVDAVLIGETLMQSPNKKRMLDILKGE